MLCMYYIHRLYKFLNFVKTQFYYDFCRYSTGIFSSFHTFTSVKQQF